MDIGPQIFYYAMGMTNLGSAVASTFFVRELLLKKAALSGAEARKAKKRMSSQIYCQAYNFVLQILQFSSLMLVLNNGFIQGRILAQITSTGVIYVLFYFVHVDWIILDALTSGYGGVRVTFSFMNLFRVLIFSVAALAFVSRFVIAGFVVTTSPQLGSFGDLIDIGFTIFTLICDNYLTISIIRFIASKSRITPGKASEQMKRIITLLIITLVSEWTTIFLYALVVELFSSNEALNFAAGSYAVATSGVHSIVNSYVLTSVKRILLQMREEVDLSVDADIVLKKSSLNPNITNGGTQADDE